MNPGDVRLIDHCNAWNEYSKKSSHGQVCGHEVVKGSRQTGFQRSTSAVPCGGGLSLCN